MTTEIMASFLTQPGNASQAFAVSQISAGNENADEGGGCA
jgi:hypothetical protein